MVSSMGYIAVTVVSEFSSLVRTLHTAMNYVRLCSSSTVSRVSDYIAQCVNETRNCEMTVYTFSGVQAWVNH